MREEEERGDEGKAETEALPSVRSVVLLFAVAQPTPSEHNSSTSGVFKNSPLRR